jgi:eukaryotic-like serine/threonine-protein kinase
VYGRTRTSLSLCLSPWQNHAISMNDTATFSRVRKADLVGQTPASKSRGLPHDVITRAAHRVGTAALTWAGAYVAAIGLNEYAAHTLGKLAPHGWNLGHTVAAIFVAVSLGLFAISRSRSLSAERLLDLGLVYEVVGGFAVVLGTSAGMVWDERAHILGLPWICVWIAGFPFIVPATPARASVAAFLTALMAPLGLATWHVLSGTPMPGARVWSGITMPTLICAGVATIGSRIVYGLGRDIERAREMGAYRLEERLGHGGMGEIWRARHRMLARPAAIKLVRSDAFGSNAATQSAVARFEREAQMTARLSSPHTVRLYDFGVTDEGTFYYAMELLEGMDLESLVRLQGPLPAERAVFFLIQACRSLAEAHELGLVHRDIKPANLFACRQGQEYDVLKVLDFGLVRPQTSTSSDLRRLTGKAVIVGTPAYMAPESATGGEVGPQTDMYSLGCVAYWLLTGQPVFQGDTPIEVLMRHVRDEPVPLRSRAEIDIPEALDAAILSCLAKDPKRRPHSAEALARILEAMPLERPWTRTRARESWWAHGEVAR